MASLWDDLGSLVNSDSSFSAKTGERGTIKPKANFDAGDDAVALRKAIEGLGTTEKTLIDILTHRSSAQRQLICEAYQGATGRVRSHCCCHSSRANYSHLHQNRESQKMTSSLLHKFLSLLEDVKGDTHGDFESLLVALITPPAVYDCHEVMRAMKGAGTDDSILIEIFASRSNEQIAALCDVYLQETEKKLTLDLKKEVSGDFVKALLLLAEGKRDESTDVDKDKAKEDAKTLYDAGEKKWGTDESKFIDILCQRSIPQLRQTLVEYKNISGKTLQESIEGEMSGELEELLVAIVKCVKSVPAYFAERLYGSMKGGGTDELTLNRIMVSRSEIDLMDIRAEFKKLYEYSLHSAIESDLGGDHGDCVKAICGGDD
ncbi:annexin A3a isoform X2 [Chelmon rostratus]|uniref:annexin A3a isoform X2 n=1 Tax=Chelmon rostratus TaxID=109905 RepID=UPI001BEBE855|nr:annexin A3a isoform X2 [Chelmon rostratus]